MFFLFSLAIHDQGAGGNGNVLKELVEPNGAVVFTKEFQLGDPTITTLELWGAEYQENDALLCTKEHRNILEGNDYITLSTYPPKEWLIKFNLIKDLMEKNFLMVFT